MSIEDALAKLTAAVEANTAALKAAGGSATTTTKAEKPAATTKAEKPAATTKAESKPKNDRSAVNAALEKVKDEKGVDDAKKIISEIGGVAARKDIPEDKFDAVVDACKAALEGGGSDDDL